MICFPNAKINLGLNIIEKREDGYHSLETVMIPIPIYDVLEFREAKTFDLEVFGKGEFGSNNNNTIYKVWLKLKQEFNIPSFNIKLLKNIPTQAGLGGGSADASFFLKEVNDNYNLGISISEMERLSSEIGSDCPFFIRNKPAFAESKGEILSEISVPLLNKHITIIKPDFGISTKQAFRQLRLKNPQTSINKLITSPISKWKSTIKNDFEEVAFYYHPELMTLSENLYKLGAKYVSMSGSGPSIFAISESKLDLKHMQHYNFVRQFNMK